MSTCQKYWGMDTTAADVLSSNKTFYVMNFEQRPFQYWFDHFYKEAKVWKIADVRHYNIAEGRSG